MVHEVCTENHSLNILKACVGVKSFQACAINSNLLSKPYLESLLNWLILLLYKYTALKLTTLWFHNRSFAIALPIHFGKNYHDVRCVRNYFFGVILHAWFYLLSISTGVIQKCKRLENDGFLGRFQTSTDRIGRLELADAFVVFTYGTCEQGKETNYVGHLHEIRANLTPARRVPSLYIPNSHKNNNLTHKAACGLIYMVVRHHPPLALDPPFIIKEKKTLTLYIWKVKAGPPIMTCPKNRKAC